MEIIPAIDLQNGNVVRLTKGKLGSVTTYYHLGDPISAAKRWKSEGATFLHIIDLDATLSKGNNRKIIANIAKTVDLPLQVGGGIRDYSTAESLLNFGIDKIILGSLAIKNPRIVKKLLEKYGLHRIIVALDFVGKEIQYDGWKKNSGIKLESALNSFTELGVTQFLLTNIVKDGTLSGMDEKTLQRLKKIRTKFPNHYIIFAGGITFLNDLELLQKIKINCVVVGKALYEGFLTFEMIKDLINCEHKQ